MSDHNSGPRALAGPEGDITDLYVFPSPQQPEHLVLVLNVRPFADQSTFFSDAITYRFRLRPIASAGAEPSAVFAVGDSEWTAECTFEAPAPREGSAARMQVARCVTSAGDVVSFTVNDERGGQANGLRAFAGLRSDCFFIDLKLVKDIIATRRLPSHEAQSDSNDPSGPTSGMAQRSNPLGGTNALTGANVLSIVVEVERARLRGREGPLVAVVGETRFSSTPHVRIERIGRPEIKNLLLGTNDFDPVNRDIDLRDLYNGEDAFHLGHAYARAYRTRLNANLAFFDGLDGKIDWPLDAQGAHPLTDLLLADFLVVDTSKPFATETIYEIEQSLVRGRVHATCGGRPLDDDMVDRFLTWLVNGGAGPRIRDGVDEATVRAADTFPYVARPNLLAATTH